MHRKLHFLPRLSGAKFFFIILFVSAALLSSCDKSSVIGLDVQPSNDLLNVGVQDTITLVTNTEKIDSIRTDESVMGLTQRALIGKMIDPVFGKTTASLYTQLATNSNLGSTAFGASPLIDSLVLVLVYDGASAAYGNLKIHSQTMNVYLLNEPVVLTNSYYSNHSLSHDNVDLADAASFVAHPADSVAVGGVMQKPQLRIRLKNIFGQTILNNQSTGAIATNAAFQEFIKGLYITTENTSGITSGEGNVIKFKMEESKLAMYYTSDTTHSEFDFTMNGVAHFTKFSHDYSNGASSQLTAQLNGTATPPNQLAFIQSMSGVKTKISTPYLLHMNDSGRVAINQATLVIKVAGIGTSENGLFTSRSGMVNPFDPNSSQANMYTPPPVLVLGGINNDGTGYDLPDANEGSSYYGGQYDAVNHEYRFNIARYIQQVLSGEHSNNGLYLIVPPGYADIYANRVVTGGGAPGPQQMKLSITFTKLH